MAGCRAQVGATYATYRLLVLALWLLLCGCSAKLSYRGVPLPIVVGDRLHVGSEAGFGCAELLEFHRGRVMHHEVVAPYASEFAQEDDAAAVAHALAGHDPGAAIRGLEIRVGVVGIFVLAGGGGDAEIVATGEVVGINPGEGRHGCVKTR